MKEKQQHLTLEGIKKFQDELDHLTQVRMEEIKVKLQEARAQGDLSEMLNMMQHVKNKQWFMSAFKNYNTF